MSIGSYDAYMKLEKALASLIPNEKAKFSAQINLKLERIRTLLVQLGNPEHHYPVIMVGGTSGKGSTAAMIASILTEAGYKTGLHTSPHLQVVNERFKINNRPAHTDRLYSILERMKPLLADTAHYHPEFGTPSYFEVQVAMALTLFKEEGVDIAVVEVGLGGTLDATNTIDAKVVVLTNVGLDHTEILGDTIEEIAADKAGIIKPNQVVISGFKQDSTRAIVQQRCRDIHATLYQYGTDFTVEINPDGTFKLTIQDEHITGLKTGLEGTFQSQNAACAVMAVKELPGFTVSNDVIKKGLMQTTLGGRMELMQENPTVIIDGAHNPDKMQAFINAVNHKYPEKSKLMVLAMKKGKDVENTLLAALKDIKTLILTKFYPKGLWESIAPGELKVIARKISPNIEIIEEEDPLHAVKKGLSLTTPDELLVITGSLYLIGDIRGHWHDPFTD